MDGVAAVFFLSIIAIILLWGFAFVLLKKHQQKKGTNKFFIFLIVAVALDAILFAFLVVPNLGCTGWFCGFYEFLIYLVVTIVLFLILPIILLIIARLSKAKNNHDEIIDRTSGF